MSHNCITAMEVRQRSTGESTVASPHSNGQSTTYSSPLDKKFHRQRSAFLGPDKPFSFTSFTALFFCYSGLAAAGLLLENFNKYGFHVAPLNRWVHAFDTKANVPGFYPAAYMLLYMPMQMFAALGIEKAIAAEVLPERAGMIAHIANLAWHVCYPVVGVWLWAWDSISLIGAYIVCQLNAATCLKTVSFVHANWWARDKKRRQSGGEVVATGVATNGSVANGSATNGSAGNGSAANGSAANGSAANGSATDESVTDRVTPSNTASVLLSQTEYPDNLTVGNTVFYLAAPTLCYEMDYPRNDRVNYQRVLIRLLVLLAAMVLHFVLFQQWLVPTYMAVSGSFEREEWLLVAERILKIAIPNNLIWLLFFYEMFHVNVILMSELTRFADRRTYENWWEAEDITVFWRRWNLPVHYWCVRHLYLPMMRRGYSKTFAKYVVFAISGVAHEYLVSVPLRLCRPYAFFGMMAQIPFSDLSEWVSKRMGPRWGNVLVWLNICLGQPLAVLLYTRDYVATHYAGDYATAFGIASPS